MLLLSWILAAALAAGPRDVLVTVDDLPLASRAVHPDPAERTRIVRDLVRILGRHGIHAVGFVKADAVVEAADRDVLDLWLSAGHELGTHGHAHLDYAATDPSVYLADLDRGRRSLAAFLEGRGRTLRWFRFPYLREGDTPEKLEAARTWLSRRGLRNLPVTIETQDWAFEEPWVRARRAGDRSAASRTEAEALASLRTSVRRDEHEGDRLGEGGTLPQVLLLHANAVGTEIWDPLFTWLEETGHRFADADAVLAHPLFSEPHRYVASSGGSLWLRLRHQRDAEAIREELTALLVRQAEAWSRGDLEGFVSAYAEDATFLSGSGVVQGKEAVHARYAARYPDPAAMGTLRLEVLEIRPLWGLEPTVLGESAPGGIHGAGVAARWTLTPASGESASGTTLLLFRRGREGWRIVQDASR